MTLNRSDGWPVRQQPVNELIGPGKWKEGDSMEPK